MWWAPICGQAPWPPIMWSQSLWSLISVALSTIGATGFLKLFLWGWSAIFYHFLYSFHFILLLSSCFLLKCGKPLLWISSIPSLSASLRCLLVLFGEMILKSLASTTLCNLTSPKSPGPARSHFLTCSSAGLTNLIHLLYLITFSPETYIFSVSYQYLFNH